MAPAYPPPVTFRQSEVAGGIQLAPLADFLAHLSEPKHFIKLADILERYRTPRSYHRYDYRIVDSSELPPSPRNEHDDEDLKQLWEAVRGSPIFLEGNVEDSGDGEMVGEKGKGKQKSRPSPVTDATLEADGSQARKEGQPATNGALGGPPATAHAQGPGVGAVPSATLVDDASTGVNGVGLNALGDATNPGSHGPNSEYHTPNSSLTTPNAAGISAAVSGRAAAPESTNQPSLPNLPEPLPDIDSGLLLHDDLMSLPELTTSNPAPGPSSGFSSVVSLTSVTLNGGTTVPTSLADAPTALALLSPPPTSLGATPPLIPDAEVFQALAAMSTAPTTPHQEPSADEVAQLLVDARESRSPSPFTPAYAPSPGGSAHCVRELRLDIRTLDVACVWELEIWRCDVLGLEQIDKAVPDSKWYKAPPPEPKRRGRLPKAKAQDRTDGDAAPTVADDGPETARARLELSPSHSPSPEEIAVPEVDDSGADPDFHPTGPRPKASGSRGRGRSRGRPRGSRARGGFASLGRSNLPSSEATELAQHADKGAPAAPSTPPVFPQPGESNGISAGPSTSIPRGQKRGPGRPRGSRGRGARTLAPRPAAGQSSQEAAAQMGEATVAGSSALAGFAQSGAIRSSTPGPSSGATINAASAGPGAIRGALSPSPDDAMSIGDAVDPHATAIPLGRHGASATVDATTTLTVDDADYAGPIDLAQVEADSPSNPRLADGVIDTRSPARRAPIAGAGAPSGSGAADWAQAERLSSSASPKPPRRFGQGRWDVESTPSRDIFSRSFLSPLSPGDDGLWLQSPPPVTRSSTLDVQDFPKPPKGLKFKPRRPRQFFDCVEIPRLLPRPRSPVPSPSEPEISTRSQSRARPKPWSVRVPNPPIEAASSANASVSGEGRTTRAKRPRVSAPVTSGNASASSAMVAVAPAADVTRQRQRFSPSISNPRPRSSLPTNVMRARTRQDLPLSSREAFTPPPPPPPRTRRASSPTPLPDWVMRVEANEGRANAEADSDEGEEWGDFRGM